MNQPVCAVACRSGCGEGRRLRSQMPPYAGITRSGSNGRWRSQDDQPPSQPGWPELPCGLFRCYRSGCRYPLANSPVSRPEASGFALIAASACGSEAPACSGSLLGSA